MTSTNELLQEKTSENTEADPPPDPDRLCMTPPRISVSLQRFEEVTCERDAVPTEEQCSATLESDSGTLSSEESSEDEEDVKDVAETEGEATSILPSSVLDKASVIAHHFTNSVKRGSVTRDDGHSLSSASPRLLSRTNSRLSLGADPAENLGSISSDPGETFVTDPTLFSPWDDSLFDANRDLRRRRDSTLSKQNQLLISKIKNYYENAENQSSAFSLQRRESLTYIPTGLVRSSITRINSIPKEETIHTASSSTASSLEPILPADTLDCMVSSDSLYSLSTEQINIGQEDSRESQLSRPNCTPDNPSEDEKFIPSSEMIKIWQTIERESTRSHTDNKMHKQHREVPQDTRTVPDMTSHQEQRGLSSFTRKPKCPSAFQSLKVFGEEAIVLRPAIPWLAQLKAEAEGKQPREDDTDQMKSKVLHLARQYSQRIKTTKPVVRQRSQGLLINKKSLPCVVEEKESLGTLLFFHPFLFLRLKTIIEQLSFYAFFVLQVMQSQFFLTRQAP